MGRTKIIPHRPQNLKASVKTGAFFMPQTALNGGLRVYKRERLYAHSLVR